MVKECIKDGVNRGPLKLSGSRISESDQRRNIAAGGRSVSYCGIRKFRSCYIRSVKTRRANGQASRTQVTPVFYKSSDILVRLCEEIFAARRAFRRPARRLRAAGGDFCAVHFDRADRAGNRRGGRARIEARIREHEINVLGRRASVHRIGKITVVVRDQDRGRRGSRRRGGTGHRA